MLEDNQIYEDEEYVLKIEKLGESFHALIFKKENQTLKFINAVFDRDVRIERLIKKMNLSKSNKFITLRER